MFTLNEMIMGTISPPTVSIARSCARKPRVVVIRQMQRSLEIQKMRLVLRGLEEVLLPVREFIDELCGAGNQKTLDLYSATKRFMGLHHF